MLLFLLLMIWVYLFAAVRRPVSTSSRHRDDNDSGEPRADRRLGSDGRYKWLVRRLRHWKRLAARMDGLTSLQQFECWQLWKAERHSPDVSSSKTNALQQSINVTSTCNERIWHDVSRYDVSILTRVKQLSKTSKHQRTMLVNNNIYVMCRSCG